MYRVITIRKSLKQESLTLDREVHMKAAIVMGSKSDYPVVERAEAILKEFGVVFETRIISAHRTPRVARKMPSKTRWKEPTETAEASC